MAQLAMISNRILDVVVLDLLRSSWHRRWIELLRWGISNMQTDTCMTKLSGLLVLVPVDAVVLVVGEVAWHPGSRTVR